MLLRSFLTIGNFIVTKSSGGIGATVGANVGFIEISSDKGHDSFLLDIPEFLKTVKNFLDANY